MDIVQLGIAVFSTLAPVVGFFIWRIRGLHRELKEAKDKLDPALELERKDLRNKLDRTHEQIGELTGAIRDADTRIGSLQNELTQRTRKSSEYFEKAKQFRQLTIQYRDSADQLEQQLNQSNTRFQAKLATLVESKDQEWEVQLEQIKGDWTAEVENLNDTAKELEHRLNSKIDEGENQLKKIQDLDEQIEAHRERDERILRRVGRIWEPIVPDEVPKFVPLSDRRAPIIAVLNLKGGVGKTTLTANLAATLGHPDISRPALVVDLDYQRSLTQLCCTGNQLQDLNDQEECIQHFFLRRESAASQSGDSPHSRALLQSCAQVPYHCS